MVQGLSEVHHDRKCLANSLNFAYLLPLQLQNLFIELQLQRRQFQKHIVHTFRGQNLLQNLARPPQDEPRNDARQLFAPLSRNLQIRPFLLLRNHSQNRLRENFFEHFVTRKDPGIDHIDTAEKLVHRVLQRGPTQNDPFLAGKGRENLNGFDILVFEPMTLIENDQVTPPELDGVISKTFIGDE